MLRTMLAMKLIFDRIYRSKIKPELFMNNRNYSADKQNLFVLSFRVLRLVSRRLCDMTEVHNARYPSCHLDGGEV